MKNLLLIAFILIPFSGISQTPKPIDSFLGIKFGSSTAQVKAALLARGATFDKENSEENRLIFDKVSMGSRNTYFFYVETVDGAAYQATFLFKATLEPRTLDFYNSLKKDIDEVYGFAKTNKTFKTPYEDGDGYEITAIKTGNAEFNTYWLSGENGIKLSIDDDLVIRLIYQDGNLFDKVINRKKQKDKSDF